MPGSGLCDHSAYEYWPSWTVDNDKSCKDGRPRIRVRTWYTNESNIGYWYVQSLSFPVRNGINTMCQSRVLNRGSSRHRQSEWTVTDFSVMSLIFHYTVLTWRHEILLQRFRIYHEMLYIWGQYPWCIEQTQSLNGSSPSFMNYTHICMRL